ncbi:MAG: tetratricopeptide repeat protein, partial [Phycisphaerae bacterium]|nr:tetratricopeptide repeat protein [Phycisphaerae bacterium]
HANTLHFLGIIEHNRGNHDAALGLIHRSLELDPDNPTYLQNAGGMLKDLGRYEEAIPHLERAIAHKPHDFSALGNLSTTYCRLGRNDKAIEYGQRTLEEKSRQACQQASPDGITAAGDFQPKPFRSDDRRRNVIAFSLWGTNDYYIQGAIANAMLAPHVYPEWICRFYCDLSVPRTVIEQLQRHGAQVTQFNETRSDNYGLFWRFFVANDPDVDRFLCRDCDCRLNVKERVAVEEWIASNQCFHIMRDNIVHVEVILAGMWGGITGVLPDIRPLSIQYMKTYGQRWADQHFLREEIWPVIKDISLAHDSYYRLGNTKRFPEFGSLPRPLHVGGSTPRPAELRSPST